MGRTIKIGQLIVLLLLSFSLLGQRSNGLIIGDSTIDDGYGQNSVSSYLLTASEIGLGHILTDISAGSSTIALQKASFLALTNKSQITYAIIEIGLNDCNPATAVETTIAEYQDLITTIKYYSPLAKIIVATMTPAKERQLEVWGIDGYNKWLDLNNSIKGTFSGTNITNVDFRVYAHTALLGDGSDNLNPIYDVTPADGIHENNAGRIIIAAQWKTGLQYLGIIEGGTKAPVIQNKKRNSINNSLLVK